MISMIFWINHDSDYRIYRIISGIFMISAWQTIADLVEPRKSTTPGGGRHLWLQDWGECTSQHNAYPFIIIFSKGNGDIFAPFGETNAWWIPRQDWYWRESSRYDTTYEHLLQRNQNIYCFWCYNLSLRHKLSSLICFYNRTKKHQERRSDWIKLSRRNWLKQGAWCHKCSTKWAIWHGKSMKPCEHHHQCLCRCQCQCIKVDWSTDIMIITDYPTITDS